jgi:hypothetical protein
VLRFGTWLVTGCVVASSLGWVLELTPNPRFLGWFFNNSSQKAQIPCSDAEPGFPKIKVPVLIYNHSSQKIKELVKSPCVKLLSLCQFFHEKLPVL